MAKFSTGDKVRLKSGGPVMTVKDSTYESPEHISSVENIVCTWIDESGNVREFTFKDAMLETVR